MRSSKFIGSLLQFPVSSLRPRSSHSSAFCVPLSRCPRSLSDLPTQIFFPTLKMASSGVLTIGTHNGHFHADEALAVFVLRVLPEYTSSPVVRTRDPAVLAQCHTVVDVGGVYDHSKFRYDHHQREFTTKFPGREATKLSSAGLVYLHFGRRVIAQLTGLEESGEEVEILFQHLYDTFIEAFDANDNGVSAYDQAALGSAGIKPRFKDGVFSIASCVNRFNNAGSLTSSLIPGYVPKEGAEGEKGRFQDQEDALFGYASQFVGTQFLLAVQSAFKAWLPARDVVRKAYRNRTSVHPSGKIMELPYSKDGLPWYEHLYTIEAETAEDLADPFAGEGEVVNPDGYDGIAAERKTKKARHDETDGVATEVLYVIFPESDAADARWRVRAVGVKDKDFVNRKDLPNEWKGVRDEELEKVSGVKGAIFVHASGFIGGAKSRDGALAMATKAVDLAV